jgi:flagellin
MLSIQTNVTSLIAQQNLSTNTTSESNTIEQLTSGYRINSSGDDAAGLAVANQYQSDIGQLTQGVQNANTGVSTLQIIDGGLSNISQILNRLETLATESASGTFTGDRTTLNNEYQSDLQEITRQAQNIGLNLNGQFNTQLNVYIGGAELSTQASSAQVQVNLNGPANAVDAASLGLSTSSILGGGTSFANPTNTITTLNNPAANFENSTTNGGDHGETFTIDYVNSQGHQARATVAVAATAGGYTGATFVTALNKAIQGQGISGIYAQIGNSGDLQLGGAGLLQASVTSSGDPDAIVTDAGSLLNANNYQTTQTGAFTNFTGTATQTVTVTSGGTNYTVNLSAANASSVPNAVTAFNTALAGSGVYAVADPAGTGISLQGASTFQVTTAAAVAGTGGGDAFQATAGAVAVGAPNPLASATGNAQAAITAIASAVSTLGLVQGAVGTGENKLGFAINLANSQISSFSAAESAIKDVDVAAAASNLSKEQILQQSSVAALVQANSLPQAVLSLLKSS